MGTLLNISLPLVVGNMGAKVQGGLAVFTTGQRKPLDLPVIRVPGLHVASIRLVSSEEDDTMRCS